MGHVVITIGLVYIILISSMNKVISILVAPQLGTEYRQQMAVFRKFQLKYHVWLKQFSVVRFSLDFPGAEILISFVRYLLPTSPVKRVFVHYSVTKRYLNTLLIRQLFD